MPGSDNAPAQSAIESPADLAVTPPLEEKVQPWKTFLPVPEHAKPTEDYHKEVRVQKEKDFHDSS